jgi:hypothetical protein
MSNFRLRQAKGARRPEVVWQEESGPPRGVVLSAFPIVDKDSGECVESRIHRATRDTCRFEYS